MNVIMVKCDACGKLAERPEEELPRGWRVLRLPFSGTDREACSPACAKLLLGADVDEEWGVDLQRHVYLGSSSMACGACGKPAEHPVHGGLLGERLTEGQIEGAPA